MLVQLERESRFLMKTMKNIFFAYLLMIVSMHNYQLILIKPIHSLVNRKKSHWKKFIDELRNILEKARQNNGRVFIHCLGE